MHANLLIITLQSSSPSHITPYPPPPQERPVRRRPPRTPSPALPEAPPPPRLTAPEDELEEGEIPDVTATQRMLRRWSRRHNRRKLDPLKERPPSVS